MELSNIKEGVAFVPNVQDGRRAACLVNMIKMKFTCDSDHSAAIPAVGAVSAIVQPYRLL